MASYSKITWTHSIQNKQFINDSDEKLEYKSDYLIIGGGIIGLSIARELINRFPESKIILLEKELNIAYHSSGRNSGVLHAGFYYTADSLKAKFTVEGNLQMRDYCYKNGLKINECKKVVVAKSDDEVNTIFELEKRGIKNGVQVQVIDTKELHEIDPNVRTCQYALYSPSTATVDPVEVCITLKDELIGKGVIFIFNQGYKKHLGDNSILTTQNRKISSKKIINAAGLYADKIAKDFGFSSKYIIIPFKGIYLKYKGEQNPVRTNVYPVPNLRNPFLGVHFTITVDGGIKIGPTSVPAFWRENYSGFENFKLDEFISIFGWEGLLFLQNEFNFRSLAVEEIKKYYKKYFIGLAGQLVNKIDSKGFSDWGKPGIRAQLLNKETKELVMDFVIEGNRESVHVLNAVSPAFTCSFPFAKYIVDSFII